MNRVSRSETVEDSPALQRWVSVYKKQSPFRGGHICHRLKPALVNETNAWTLA